MTLTLDLPDDALTGLPVARPELPDRLRLEMVEEELGHRAGIAQSAGAL